MVFAPLKIEDECSCMRRWDEDDDMDEDHFEFYNNIRMCKFTYLFEQVQCDQKQTFKQFLGRTLSEIHTYRRCEKCSLLFKRTNNFKKIICKTCIVQELIDKQCKSLGTCSICLEPIIQRNITTLSCSHTFHKLCIKKWTKGNCPICRAEIN